MNEQQKKSVSKFLSLILRHQPEVIGITLDENGWTDVDELIAKMNTSGHRISFDELEEVVETNDKQRFAFSDDYNKIRASQGHSVNISLGLDPQEPPEYLYHGTVAKFLDSIRKEGLQRMSRQHLHLSRDRETAMKVGSRRGIPVILNINTGAMHQDGFLFYLSDNGVWLTDHVPAKYINF
ncbi:RNA 2'-phosphotransferase [Chitinophaga filiformis]|uniref:Probable RNA 2'-phosphotransferase n=1 Tax=Chitinophaga filiformis TaxID=104663 RepID=A0A1G7HQ22_CHIFI|nr:RNA 2'-phosphotransferase [Chitinophaga filiformis]SDF02398.1 putative RNA 2'-phosphotransferase [Chitinophaga filiformis]